MVHKTGSIMFFTVQDALRNRVESYLEIGERWRETVRGKVERHDTISVLLSMQRFTEKSQLSSSFERNSVIFSMHFLILCKKVLRDTWMAKCLIQKIFQFQFHRI